MSKAFRRQTAVHAWQHARNNEQQTQPIIAAHCPQQSAAMCNHEAFAGRFLVLVAARPQIEPGFIARTLTSAADAVTRISGD
jgi:hypothetical protein